MEDIRPMTYSEQLLRLRSRGLGISDDDAALASLTHLNFHRLQLYTEAFVEDCGDGRLREGTTMEDVLGLYAFDQRLRGLTLSASKLVEVSVRSRLAHVMEARLGPIGYLLTSNYRDLGHAIRSLEGVRAEIARSREPFLLPYNSSREGLNRLPMGIAIEAFSFGSTSKLYANLADSAIQREIAATYSLNETLMVPALHHLNTARNMVAHHAQFWNLRIQEKLRIPSKEPADLRRSLVADADAPGCYNTMTLFAFMAQAIPGGQEVTLQIGAHLATLPMGLMAKAGMPADWRSRPVWKRAGGDSEAADT